LGDVFVDTPAMFVKLLGNEEYDWKFHSTPQACPSSLQREQRLGC
jgi:hypothetical protein